MPFDGKRMIFGGFAPVLELGSRTWRPLLSAQPATDAPCHP